MKKTTRYLALGLAMGTVAMAAGAQTARKNYIVQLAEPPAAAYEGGVAGYAPTRPAAGSRINVSAADVQSYLRYLDVRQSQVQATVPGAPVYYRYTPVVFNGFAAKLTDAELQKLAANPAVAAITLDEARPLDTSYTTSFLGLTAPGGAWSRTDAAGRPIKGENVIIAHVDSGVWPENPSFSDKVDANGKPVPYYAAGTVVYSPLPAGRYTGICEAGEGFTAAMCNNKLLGARAYRAGWDASGRPLNATEYRSPRDKDGHGSHTLSTSGGNEGVTGSVSGTQITGISGVAPRARLAMYKVCYDAVNTADDGCFNSDSVAAITQAVIDGVDVINFSIGGSQTSYLDAVETAFRNAAAAGVFVAASSGNAGPANTLAHISPWITTVGNSTHDRYTVATVTLGSGVTVQGASFQTAGLPTTPLVWSRNVGFGAAAAQGSNQALCYGAADGVAALLDPAKVSGKIIVCDRGGNVLVNKVANAKAAGAVGVIIQNTPVSADTTPLISAVLPTVHLPLSAFAAVTAEASKPDGTASFSGGVQVPGVIAPVMADTSSRGPNRGDPNILKPDVTAPGTDIIAAYAAPLTAAERNALVAGTFMATPAHEMISGTSMAAPHVAGTAALVRQANPGWSPAAIKSAIMTSANQTVRLANGNVDTNRWGYGAGHLNPNGALDTSLVYDAGTADYTAYIAGAVESWNLNLASITRANIIGSGTVRRTLKNTGSSTVTYVASASLPDFSITVSPATLTLAPGATGTYTVSMTRTSAPLEAWRFGEVRWTGDGGKVVRSPVQAKASAFVGSTQITDTQAVGSKVFTVGTGWDGTMVTTGTGLVPATRVSGTSVLNQPDVCFPITVPSGALQLRVQLFNSETGGGSASDLDLAVYRGTTLVGTSGGSTSDELVTLNAPTAGSYSACVEAFAPAGGTATFTLSYWVVGPASGPQTLKAFGAPKVYLGGTASVGISWNVPAGQRYLGVVQYRQTPTGAAIGQTTVFVDTVAVPAATATAPVLRSKPLR